MVVKMDMILDDELAEGRVCALVAEMDELWAVSKVDVKVFEMDRLTVEEWAYVRASSPVATMDFLMADKMELGRDAHSAAE